MERDDAAITIVFIFCRDETFFFAAAMLNILRFIDATMRFVYAYAMTLSDADAAPLMPWMPYVVTPSSCFERR